MNDLKRYDFKGGADAAQWHEQPFGKWVLADDAIERITHAEARVRGLKAELSDERLVFNHANETIDKYMADAEKMQAVNERLMSALLVARKYVISHPSALASEVYEIDVALHEAKWEPEHRLPLPPA